MHIELLSGINRFTRIIGNFVQIIFGKLSYTSIDIGWCRQQDEPLNKAIRKY